jgi:hypothetical protein
MFRAQSLGKAAATASIYAEIHAFGLDLWRMRNGEVELRARFA